MQAAGSHQASPVSGIIEPAQLHRPAGLWCMHEPAVAQVDGDVIDLALAFETEEQQVAGDQLPFRHRRCRAVLVCGGALESPLILERSGIGRGDVRVVVHHHQAQERAEGMATEIRKETQFPERVMIVEFDEVLAWHLGPGTVGVSVTDLYATDFPILPPSPQGEA